MKHGDRPITRPREDVLGRSKFSLALARAIDGLLIANEGFVIAVIGEWGSGKSSVVEMMLRHLTHIEMERASKKNPSGGLESLDTLEELSEVYDLIRDRVATYDAANLDLSSTRYGYRIDLFEKWLDSIENGKKADKYWNLLDSVDNHRHTIQLRFSPWLISGRSEMATALISELARALGQQLGPEINEAFVFLLKRMSELAPMAGIGIDLATGSGIGKLLSAGGSLSGKVAATLASGPTLDQLRENLRNLLKGIDQRVLVVIDDLDRLTPTEAREMVSLVKSLGDLPNVIYLLSYDQSNLEKLISEGTALDGRDYLRKIVQYPVNIPPILGAGLTKILDADLSELLGDVDEINSRRIGSTWQYIFRHYLRTPRDVRLYTNSLTVSLSSQRDFVDPIDLMLLELLRLHEPEIYAWVRYNLDELAE